MRRQNFDKINNIVNYTDHSHSSVTSATLIRAQPRFRTTPLDVAMARLHLFIMRHLIIRKQTPAIFIHIVYGFIPRVPVLGRVYT